MNGARVVRPTDAATVIHGAGDEYRYLATGRQTHGSYFMLEAVVPPGAGPPPHVQSREEEGFYVLEGELTFYPDGEEVVAGAGTFLHVPRDVVHNFKNLTQDDARVLIWFAPAGIEKMFSEMAREPDRYLEIGAAYGVTFPDSDGS